MLQRLARTMYRRRRYVLVGWIILLVATFMLASSVGGAFKTEFKLPGTESQAAFDLLEKSSFRNRQIQAQIVFGSRDGIDTPEIRAAMEDLFAEVEEKITDVDVASPYTEEGARQISRNGQIAYAEVNFADRSGEELTEAGKEIKQFAADIKVPGLTIEFGGDVFADPEVGGASEAIGIAAAMATPHPAPAHVVARAPAARVPLPDLTKAPRPPAPPAIQPRDRHDPTKPPRPLTKQLSNNTRATTTSTWIKPLSV